MTTSSNMGRFPPRPPSREERGLSEGARPRQRAALADRKAREFLRNADPVLAGVIDAHPAFRPRAWMDELPLLDGFGTLIFQVVGQQLSVAATRTIVSRIEERFGGRLPSPADLLAADPEVLRAAGALGSQERDAADARGAIRGWAAERCGA